MIDREREHLEWQRRQLPLRRKYADTPPGLTAQEARMEEHRLQGELRDLERNHGLRILSDAQLPPEPFVGRRRELSYMARFFADGGRILFLSGIAGIGKTALARAFARQQAGSWDHVLFLDCRQGLEQALADDGQLRIAGWTAPVGTRKQYAREKLQALRKIAGERKLLIVLDHITSPEGRLLTELRALPCEILGTTRLSEALLNTQKIPVLPVEGLPDGPEREEFVRLCLGRDPDPAEREESARTARALRGHPGKLKLLLAGDTGPDLELRMARSVFSDVRLKKSEIQILCELAWLLPAGIPEEVYLTCTEEKPERLARLKNISLVQEQAGPGDRAFLALHPVTADAVRTEWKQTANRCSFFLQALASYAASTCTRTYAEDAWLVPQVPELLRRLPDPVSWRYGIYEGLASFQMARGDLRQARELLSTLYARVEEFYGEHHFTAFLAMRLGTCLRLEKKYPESRKCLERSCGLYRTVVPAGDRFSAERAEACENLARVYLQNGESASARDLLDEAQASLERFRDKLGTTDPAIRKYGRIRAQSLYACRASLCLQQGDLDGAGHALKASRDLYPMEDRTVRMEYLTLQTRLFLAEGDLTAARRTAEQAREYGTGSFGERARETLDAEKLLRDVLAACGTPGGADSGDASSGAQQRNSEPMRPDPDRGNPGRDLKES